ncbi:hypothetical protein D3C71_1772010 [compost metagenome]
MESRGVMPMPPAIRTVRVASRRSGKLLRGSEMASTSPSRTLSTSTFEPPFEALSCLTPIT